MKETLLKKTKYLLSFKINADNDQRYIALLEKLFYEFFINIEEIYNQNQIAPNTYYNMLLNKMNRNIKSMIIPAPGFKYHPSGFLEFSVSLKEDLEKYKRENIEPTKELKEELLQKNYFYYILKSVKNNKKGIGFIVGNDKWTQLENALNEYQAITLAKMSRSYKKEYKAIYPDGTKYHYYVYTKCLASTETLNINASAMIETIFGANLLLSAQIDSNVTVLEEFDKLYDSMLGKLQYDKFGHKVYTTTTIFNEFLKRMEKEESTYKKLEYFKKLNRLIFDIFDYKVTQVLNHKEENKIAGLLEDLKVLEASMLYNTDSSLMQRMEHVKTLKKIKTKLGNYLNQSKKQVEKEYVIYSLDKKKEQTVTSSVQPIHVDNKYVIIHLLEVRNIDNRVLAKINIHIIDYASLATKIYGQLYISLKELKHLYSSHDLGVFTKESDIIRTAIANRVLNPTIMDIIKTERHNFLGEFVYSKEEERCIIYKNKSIENLLGKVM